MKRVEIITRTYEEDRRRRKNAMGAGLDASPDRRWRKSWILHLMKLDCMDGVADVTLESVCCAGRSMVVLRATSNAGGTLSHRPHVTMDVAAPKLQADNQER